MKANVFHGESHQRGGEEHAHAILESERKLKLCCCFVLLQSAEEM
jgi:hypothetical protein